MIDHVLRVIDGELALNAVRRARRPRGTVQLRMSERGLILPPPLLDDVEHYRQMSDEIARAYERGADPRLMEHRAAEILERIEGAQSALEEEGEDVGAVVDVVEAQFADAWRRAMQIGVPMPWEEGRREVEEYLRTGRPKWVPEHDVSDARGHHLRRAEGRYQEPGVVHELREIVGRPDADGRALLEAAREAYEARRRHTLRLRARGPSGALDQARAFVERARAKRAPWRAP